jgi:uncharacterized protein
MDDDPFPGWGLRLVELADRPLIDSYFGGLHEPISDYTFSQLFTWRNSLRILWKLIDGHLCVFANGSGDLTLLLPPIGEGRSDRALAESFELMDAYNISHGVPERTRVEYASAELLGRLDCANLDVRPMGADYVYDVRAMIDLAGGDLASKRQAKNRFMRNYAYRVEPYLAADHMAGCVALLDEWKVHQDANHLEEPNAASIKRDKESIATRLCLESSQILGLQGMVVWVRHAATAAGFPDPTTPALADTDGWSLRGFTFGEHLGATQSSITIEKTDLGTKGLAQFIFSEFCRLNWSERPFVNVGDDWALETLRWTKQSYRPVKMLEKFVLRPARIAVSPALAIAPSVEIRIEPPRRQDTKKRKIKKKIGS